MAATKLDILGASATDRVHNHQNSASRVEISRAPARVVRLTETVV